MFKKYTPFILAVFLVLLSLYLISINFDEKYIVVAIVALMSVAVLVTVYLYMQNNIEKEYHQHIINTSTNIIIETDGKKLKKVNNRFFDYFSKDELEINYLNKSCICEHFIEEDEYLGKHINDVFWLEYLVKNSKNYHKVKMLLGEKVYYFSISASLSPKNRGSYIVILSDITAEEKYKIELQILTVKDALTGIGNRRVFEIKVKEAIIISQRYHFPFSLIIFDIDFFKKVNDNHGHDIGDKVLVEYTEMLRLHLRDGDEFCRIGGEEFALIVPHTTRDKAYLLAQKLRSAVESYKLILPITMSFGVTEYKSGDDNTTIYKRADEALYKSKEGGRNKVMLG